MVNGTVWRVANNVSLETADGENDLSKICNKIDRWVGNDTEEVTGRLSLRTSSTLVGGVAKLYKSEVEQLFDDVNKLDEEMSRGKKRCSTTGSSESSVTSNSVASPEVMRRQTDMQMAASITPRKKRKTKSMSFKMASIDHTMDRSSSEASSVHSRSSERNDGDRFSAFNINLSSGNLEKTKETLPESKKQSQGTQTSPTSTRREGNISSEDFNPDLPFGYIIIHDSFSSRIPSRIIFSSLNLDVNQLV